MSLSASGLVALAAYSFSYEFEAAFVPFGADVALLVDEPEDEFVLDVTSTGEYTQN